MIGEKVTYLDVINYPTYVLVQKNEAPCICVLLVEPKVARFVILKLYIQI